MNRFILLLALIWLTASCSSIKKAKVLNASKKAEAQTMVAADSLITTSVNMINSLLEEESIEEIRTVPVPMDSAGVTVFKTETVKTKRTKKIKKTKSKSDFSKAQVSTVDQSISKSDQSETKDLHKESESEEIIGQALSAVFPTWGKILGSILIAVIPVLWTILKKKKQIE